MYIRFSTKLDMFAMFIIQDGHFSWKLRYATVKTFYGSDFGFSWMGVHCVISRVGKTFKINRGIQKALSRDAISDDCLFSLRGSRVFCDEQGHQGYRYRSIPRLNFSKHKPQLGYLVEV